MLKEIDEEMEHEMEAEKPRHEKLAVLIDIEVCVGGQMGVLGGGVHVCGRGVLKGPGRRQAFDMWRGSVLAANMNGPFVVHALHRAAGPIANPLPAALATPLFPPNQDTIKRRLSSGSGSPRD